MLIQRKLLVEYTKLFNPKKMWVKKTKYIIIFINFGPANFMLNQPKFSLSVDFDYFIQANIDLKDFLQYSEKYQVNPTKKFAYYKIDPSKKLFSSNQRWLVRIQFGWIKQIFYLIKSNFVSLNQRS